MYNKIGSIGTVILGILMLFITAGGSPESFLSPFQIVGIIIGSIGLIWLVGSYINSLGRAEYQRQNFNELKLLKKKLSIIEENKAMIEKNLKDLLTKDYPNFEKELIGKFSYDNDNLPDILATIAPAIKTSETFMLYAKNIEVEINNITKCKIEIENKITEINNYNDSYCYWFTIKTPTDIQKMI